LPRRKFTSPLPSTNKKLKKKNEKKKKKAIPQVSPPSKKRIAIG
jgi:hypothetical protein